MDSESYETVRLLKKAAGNIYQNRVLREGEEIQVPQELAVAWVRDGWAKPTIQVRILMDHTIVDTTIHQAGDEAITTGLHAAFLIRQGQAELLTAGKTK